MSATKTLQHFVVDADAETGEWLGQPESTGKIELASEWAAKVDTREEHFDTYEHVEPGAIDSVTRAITVRWVA